MINKIILGLCVLILLVTPTYAVNTYEETSSVSRIVGESPTEMLRQLQRNELNLNHATYYTTDIISDKDNILKEQFNNNIEYHNLAWNFNDVQNSAKSFNKNELFILESEGSPSRLKKGSEEIAPRDLLSWQLEGKDSLVILDAPYSGIYLPKEDTFVSRLVRESSIIAPSSFNSQEFTKSLLCQLADDKNLGEVFKDARNFHYNGGSKSSQDNYIGLVLQSYQLYGNPREKIGMGWTEADKERIKRNYCKNYLENLAPNIDFLEQVGDYSKFRKHLLFEIPSNTVTQAGEFSILNTENTYQNLEPNEIVEPIAVRKTHFPINTIITGYNLESVENPVELEISNLPIYMNSFVQRKCYEDSRNYKVEFENAYTNDNLEFIARIYPMEIINCKEGKVKLYTKFSYSVDYIPLSPVLINKINTPSSSPVKQPIDVEMEIMPLTSSVATGSLAIFDQFNNRIWEQEITTENTNYKAIILVPEQEGYHKYSVEFMQNNETLNYKEFSIETIILTPKAKIPVTARSNEEIEINYESQLDQSFELETKYYLLHNFDIVQEGTSKKTINPRENIDAISLNGLKKEEKSYTLTLELNYLGNKKTISYLLNTNNVPLSYIETKPIYLEKERIVIPYELTDADNDPVELTIEDSRFSKEGNSIIWQTSEGDAGEYNINYKISDGIEQIEKSFTIKIEKAPEEPIKEEPTTEVPIEEPVVEPPTEELPPEIVQPPVEVPIEEPVEEIHQEPEQPQEGLVVEPPIAVKEPTIDPIAPEILELVESMKETMITNIQELSITIEEPIKTEESQEEKKLVIKEGTEPLVELIVNEDTSKVEIQNMAITKQEEGADKGFIIVSGLILPEKLTKTIYVDIKDQVATGVCIKDAEINSISEISSDCNGENEIFLQCNNETYNNYRCEALDSKYRIFGLKHSGILESSMIVDYDDDGFPNNVDCRDRDPTVYPGNAETCNDKDDNCNSEKDEGLIGVETCSAWSSVDYKGESCGKRRCETCGSPVIVTTTDECEETPCIPHPLTCDNWPDKGYYGEECGDQRCTDGCNVVSHNKKECSIYQDICTWSHKNGCDDGCGIETCVKINGEKYQRNTKDCKEEIKRYTIKSFYGVEYCHEVIDYCGEGGARGPVDCKIYCPDIIGEWSDTGLEGACGKRIIYNKCDNSIIRNTEEKECVLGDLDNNECINFDDFFIISDCMNDEYQEKCDLNKDTLVDENDITILSKWIGKGICKKEEPIQKPIVIPIIEGDIDKSLCVDFNDFFALLDNIDKEYNETFDLNKDNKIDIEDNKVIETNFGKGCEWENKRSNAAAKPLVEKNRGLSVSKTKAGGTREPNQTRIPNRKPVVKQDEPNITTSLSIIEQENEATKSLNSLTESSSCTPEIICSNWRQKDSRGGCDEQICTNGCGIEWRNYKACRGVTETNVISLCSERITCYSWSSTDSNNEGCGEQLCTDGCGNRELNIKGCIGEELNKKETASCSEHISCYKWTTADNLVEGCGWQKCVNNCGGEFFNYQNCKEHNINKDISLCTSRITCSEWSSKKDTEEGCGVQACKDNCWGKWFNYKECAEPNKTNQFSSCTLSITCSEWSSRGYIGEACGEQKCKDSCGFEWGNNKSCSKLDQSAGITSSCIPSITCSEWSSRGYIGEACGEQKCTNGCGIEWSNHIECREKKEFPPSETSCTSEITCSPYLFEDGNGYCGPKTCINGCNGAWSSYRGCDGSSRSRTEQCIQQPTCSTWSNSDKNCGERKCIDNCGFEWNSNFQCK
ncbi:hypothetical protein HYT57_04275 [Candidatus Woesearchaeota archaeon]|nr:hypothetical protein [Candidatus Woesearchaeota archaeon]